MGSVRGNETNLSLKKRKRGGVEICLLDTSMSKNKKVKNNKKQSKIVKN